MEFEVATVFVSKHLSNVFWDYTCGEDDLVESSGELKVDVLKHTG